MTNQLAGLKKAVEDQLESCDEKWDDVDLERFLVANSGDVSKAAKQLSETISWRKKMRLKDIIDRFTSQSQENDVIKSEGLEDELHSGKVLYLGRDKLKRESLLLYPSKHIPSSDVDLNIKSIVVLIEILIHKARREQANQQNDQNFGKITILMDQSGLTRKNFDMGLVQQMVHVMQSYYPERMGKLLIVNSPWLFKASWRVIKPLLHPTTAGRISFLTSDFVNELSEFFDPETIPHHYGGIKDNHCSVFLLKLCHIVGHGCPNHALAHANEFSTKIPQEEPYDGSL